MCDKFCLFNRKDLQVVVKDIGHAGRHLLCTCGELVAFDIAQVCICNCSFIIDVWYVQCIYVCSFI